MTALLSYADIIGMNYIPASAGIILSPAEQTLAAQAVACFGFSELWSDYDLYADEIEALMADTLTALLDTTIPPPEDGMQSELLLMSVNAQVIVGAAMLYVADTTMRFGGYFRQNPATTNDVFQFSRFMAAGDWSYRITYLRGTANGILDFEVAPDGDSPVESVSVDLRGTLLANQYITGSFTLPTSKKTHIVCSCGGTTGAGFSLSIASFEFWRTN